ncbi:swi5-dependent recombination DNA repair protein 1 homolog [Sycon ciliatum]|uniref:swi5-dependent recombination DNA repair protein 1 homolog n=1 Tax=Sycon ciliatum TaxID=27933 RepID=UPI0031F700D1
MSAALKERLARSRRRRSSFQSPVLDNAKKARTDTDAHQPHTDNTTFSEGNTSSVSDCVVNTTPTTLTPDQVTPCRPKTANRRQHIGSTDPVPPLGNPDLISPPFGLQPLPDSPQSLSADPEGLVRRHDVGEQLSPPTVSSDLPASSTVTSRDERSHTGADVDCDDGDSGWASSSQDTSQTALSAAAPIPQPSLSGTPASLTPPSACSTIATTTPVVSDEQCGGTDHGEKDAVEAQHSELTAQLEADREKLRKLRLVQLYRSKHNPQELSELIGRWRQAGQDALLELHALMPEPRCALTEFLQRMNVDTKLMRYDAEEEAFEP